MKKILRRLLPFLPYLLVSLPAAKLSQAWRLSPGTDLSGKLSRYATGLSRAFGTAAGLRPADLLFGACAALVLYAAVRLKAKSAKKYRRNEEYGSARWGTPADIRPFEDPVFSRNIILTATERLTMENRPKDPRYARNKNVLVIGGSGSGKTRFWLKPNLMQCHANYAVTDPKGELLADTGSMLVRSGYQIRVFNTVNFGKSMHYNPFAYIRSEKDILKLVTVLMANTRGDGKPSDPFWEKSETLLYTALIGYLWYEAPPEEQNFSTLLKMLSAIEIRENDDSFRNPVDSLFEQLSQKDPDHFAVRQYKKFRLAAGKLCCRRLLNQCV